MNELIDFINSLLPLPAALRARSFSQCMETSQPFI